MEDCPDGRMDKAKMQIMFKSIIPEGAAGEQFLEQLFRIFDKDGDGSIDFKAGWATLIGRDTIRLRSDWLDHDVADASSLLP